MTLYIFISDTVLSWASPAVGSAHGAPQAEVERAAKAITRNNTNGSDGRYIHTWVKGLGVLAANTPVVARTQTTIPHHFGLLLLFSQHSFFSSRQESARKGGSLKRVYCCLTPTCAIRQRHRAQAKLERAMVRATRQAHSRIARSPWR